MRLWSLHPSYLDSRGLVACWRESLLAQKVYGTNLGYSKHAQLKRFSSREQISAYLDELYIEASKRGYSFDKSKILPYMPIETLPATSGQLRYEYLLLRSKIKNREPVFIENSPRYANHRPALKPSKIFHPVPGPIEDWESVKVEIEEEEHARLYI